MKCQVPHSGLEQQNPKPERDGEIIMSETMYPTIGRSTGLLDLPDHLKIVLLLKLGEVAGSPAEAQRSRWALCSSCKAFRDSQTIESLWDVHKLDLSSPDGIAPQLSRLASFRRVYTISFFANPAEVSGMVKALHVPGAEAHAGLQWLEGIPEVHVSFLIEPACLQGYRHPASPSWGCRRSHRVYSSAGVTPNNLKTWPQWDYRAGQLPRTLGSQHLMHLAILFPNLTSLLLSEFNFPSSTSDLAALRLLQGLRKLTVFSCTFGNDTNARSVMQQLGRMWQLRELSFSALMTYGGACLDLSGLATLDKLLRLDLDVYDTLAFDGLKQVAAGCRRLRHLTIRCNGLKDSPAAVAAAAVAAAATAAEATPAAAAAGFLPGAGGTITWPELRTLSFSRMEPDLIQTMLDALDPRPDSMPSLQYIWTVGINLGFDASPSGCESLQELCLRLARLHVPVRGVAFEVHHNETSPAAFLDLLGPLAASLVSFELSGWEWTCEDVQAVAAAAPKLESITISNRAAPPGEVVGEVVLSFPCLMYCSATFLDPAKPDVYDALLSLFETAQSHFVASGRQRPLKLYVACFGASNEARERLQQEWEARCEGTPLIRV